MSTSKILFGNNTTFPTSFSSEWSVVDVATNIENIQNIIDTYADGDASGGAPSGNLSSHLSEDAVLLEMPKRDYFSGFLAYFFMNGDHYQEYLEGERQFRDIQHSSCYQINRAFFDVPLKPYSMGSGNNTANLVAVKKNASDEIVEFTVFVCKMFGSGSQPTSTILVSDTGNPRLRSNVLSSGEVTEMSIIQTYQKSYLESTYGFDLSSWGQMTSTEFAKVVVSAPENEVIDTSKTFYLGICLKSDAEDLTDTGIIRTRACYSVTPSRFTSPDGEYNE